MKIFACACHGLAALVLFSAPGRAQTPTPTSAGERIYDRARDKLLQIRTVVAQAGRQSSLGSGFLIGSNGLALTNYHVVSQYALDTGTYRLEFTAPDGGKGELRLLAIDVANDLAAVRLDKPGAAPFEFDPRALEGTLPKGERLYSMGNPLDIGFTIIEGTYNGLAARTYSDRIHFSGALNPGMSGGPAVTAEGRIAGVNVAKRLGGEQVSFLVPAKFARALVARAVDAPPLSPEGLRSEIGRQLVERQQALLAAMSELGFKSVTVGPYGAPEAAADWFNCWARTNEVEVPAPRAKMNTTSCMGDTSLFVAGDLTTGGMQVSHTYLKNSSLNDFQFATFLTQRARQPWMGGWSQKWFTAQRCYSDFVARSASGEWPPLLAKWCARAHREFAGLYDIGLTVVTQDNAQEALVAQIGLQGVPYEQGVALAHRFLESVQWKK